MATLVPQKAIYPLDFPITVSLETPSQLQHTHLGTPKSIYSDKGQASSKLYKLFLIRPSHPCLRRVVTKFGVKIPEKRFVYANFVTLVLD